MNDYFDSDFTIPPLSENQTEKDVNYVYFKNPKDMLIPWVVNEFFFPTIITIGITFVIGVTGNIAVIWFMAGDKMNQR